jgi:peroxiredoxin Q/BCP
MINLRWLGFALAVLIAFAFVVKLSLAQGPAPVAGQPAPNFTLPSQDGSPVSLQQYRGKWVVLYFYPKDNTAGCTLEAHNFQRDLPRYQGLNAVIIGVSLDSEDSHRGFCAKQGLTFKLLSDKDRLVSAEYGSLRNLLGLKMAARNSFLIDPDGKIAKTWLGVSPSGHSAEVLAELGLREKGTHRN